VSGHSQWGIPLNDDEELPTGWEKHKSSSGEIYYGNQKEKITQWEKPIFDPTQIPFLAEWETKVSSRCKQIYYINKHTHKSQWNYPDEKLQQSSLSDFTDEDKIGHLIPEPTKKGAKKIAERIITWIKTKEQRLAEKPEHVPKFSIQTLVDKLISGGKDLSSKDLNSINKIIEKNLDFKNSSLLNQDYKNPVHRGIVIVLLLLCKNNTLIIDLYRRSLL